MGVVIAAIVIVALFLLWQQRDRFTTVFDRGVASQIDQATYQAVFLAGGQVYFGRARTSGDVVLLEDVFYLQQPESGQSELVQGQLIKRGNELHGPREPMIIPVAQILFIENLRGDAEVVNAITRYRSGAPGATAAPATPRATATPTRSP